MIAAHRVDRDTHVLGRKLTLSVSSSQSPVASFQLLQNSIARLGLECFQLQR
jgi:hypothetical protein